MSDARPSLPRSVAVVGTGALACLFGGHLQPHVPVTLVGTWREQLQRLQRDGVVLEELDGTRHSYPVGVADDPAAVAPADLVLVLVKSPATHRAAAWARILLGPELPTEEPTANGAGGLALSLQNGWGNLELLEGAVGARRAAVGTTEHGARFIAPGVVRHAGAGTTALARRPATAGKLEAAARLLEQAGFEPTLTDDGVSLLWGKLVVNAAINPLTALLDVPNGFLVQDPRARRLLDRAAAEAAAVARAAGARLPFLKPPNASLDTAGERAAEVCRRTAANLSSMLQDHRRGAVTEVDTITGAVVREGRRRGVATPFNALLWSLLGGPPVDDENQRAGSELPEPAMLRDLLAARSHPRGA
ncbi:MAG: 2-dehydropantoate 2-reductase [Acidobacteriota bacterium]|nr:2-dehydropantoate 2-reductase [Acidobacteriota bacterium]